MRSCESQDLTESLETLHESVIISSRKFNFFGGRLQKKLLALYKFHHFSYNFISQKNNFTFHP